MTMRRWFLSKRGTHVALPATGVDVRTGEPWERDEPLTWECMVCGNPRSDSAIDVFVREYICELGVRTRVNVRHCNDSPFCVENAPDVSTLMAPVKVED